MTDTEFKTLEELLEEQRELYKKYTSEKDRKLIKIIANLIKKEIHRKEKEGEGK